MDIDNGIQEDYCSFEVSKLLKEKGFNASREWYYVLNSTCPSIDGIMKVGDFRLNTSSLSDNAIIKDNNYAWCPTHALAIKWIRENSKRHISADFDGSAWFFIVTNLNNASDTIVHFRINDEDNYKSFQEATEAALLYTLTHLINEKQ